MSNPLPLPPMRHLRVFESAARLGGFSAAAEELHTTQSAVSRTVAELERLLGTALFERVHRGVRLTRAGELYLEAVAAGLDRVGAAGAALAAMKSAPVVIAASHGVAMLLLMPLREELYQAVGGGDVHVHIQICDYDMLSGLNENDIDIMLSYDPGGAAPRDRAVAFRQAVRPVCSPEYAREHSEVLNRPVREWEWEGLTIMDGARPSRGWATWEDWFDATGRPRSRPRLLTYFDYVFLLEEVIAGKGLAIGCRRPVAGHLERGTLVAVGDGFVEIDRPQWARLTDRGRTRPEARRCLAFFDETTRRLDGAQTQPDGI